MTEPTSTPPDGARRSEDPFFILRDSSALFQQRLTDIARQAGIASPPALKAFSEALATAHDELAAAKASQGFDQTHGLTASRITLMCDSDLELEIRIGEIARRLGDLGGNELWRVQARYMTLLRRGEMAPAENPVGPEAIGQGLWALVRNSGAGPDANFEMLGALEDLLVAQLPELYAGLNDLLAARNVAPAATQIVSSGGPRVPTASPPPPGAGGPPDPLSALQELLARQAGGGSAATGGAGGMPFPAGFVQDRGGVSGMGAAPDMGGMPGMGGIPGMGGVPGMGAGPDMAASPGLAGSGGLDATTLSMLSQLSARLDQLELSGGAATPAAAGGAGDGPPPRPVRAEDLGLAPGNPEAIALDALGLIFEAIFNTWELPDTVKTAIGRLQIPLLKLALFDPTLFADPAHPARRLINGMARAALGLPRNTPRAHPVSTRLWQLAGAVAETLQRDAAVLAAPLADLDALIAGRDEAVLAAAQAYVPLLRQHDAREQAALAAQGWLRAWEEQGAAAEILDFLRRQWVNVMEAARLDDGETDRRWQEGHAVIVDLLWSVAAKQGVEEHKRLAGLVPGLLRRINEGLDRIGTPADERAPFLDAFFTLQTAALRGSPAAPATAPAEPAAAAPADADAIETVEADGLRLKVLRRTASAYRGADASLPGRSWLQFRLEGDEALCGMVCWQNPRSGSTLLFNPEWDAAAALAAPVLAQQLRDGQARVVSGEAIFDRAAEHAMARLGGA